MNEIVFDAEFDSLYPSRIHCLSADYKGSITTVTNSDYVKKLFDLPKEENIFIGHNIMRFDVPSLERLFNINTDHVFIDTLALSWYLFPERNRHGLEEWGEYYQKQKVYIEDWESLSIDEYKRRCERDVEINKKLWEEQKSLLLEMYGSLKDVYRVCKYLTFKLKCAALAEKSQWRLDKAHVRKSIAKLLWESRPKVKALKASMPKVPNIVKKTKPKRMRKKDFSLTEVGKKWYNECSKQGLDPEDTEAITVVSGYEEPNPSSHQQVKDWLFSLGWEPETFKTNDKGKEVPQIAKLDKSGLCDSILRIDNEAVKELDGLFTINHRISTLRGFLNNEVDGFVKAEVAGFTNTLRFKHSVVVNLPAVTANYAEDIRPSLIARDGMILCGSDMLSLEDRTKQHYMVPYDPEYVEEMNVEGFDPHLDIAILGNMMSQDEVDFYKSGQDGPDKIRLKKIRHGAKTTNYSCTYGAFPPKIAKSAGISLEEATILHAAYWKRNWSIKQIADDCIVKTFNNKSWLWNPVSNMWYSLRKDKDRFSTLNQGTGSFCFDVWLGFILKEREQITAQFHDEGIFEIRPEEKKQFSKILQNAIEKTNKLLGMRRELGIDIQFGNNYGEIH